MKLKLILRNNTWYVYGYVSGKRVRESTGIARANKSAAELYLSKKISMLGGTVTTSNTFEAAANNYLTRKEGVGENDKVLIRRQSKFFGKIELDSMTPLDIQEYANVTHKNNKASTMKRDLNILKAILNRACDLGMMIKVPKVVMPTVVNDARDRNLLPHEKKAYLNELKGDEIGIFTFILYTGVRAGEVRKLQRHNLFTDHFTIQTSYKGKNGKKNVRTVNIPLKLQALLSSMTLPKSGYVFVHTDKSAGRYIGKPFSSVWLRKRNDRICKKLGIKDYRVHDHRHTYGTELKRLGTAETTIADLMGHSNLNMVRRYTKLTQKEHADIVNKLS